MTRLIAYPLGLTLGVIAAYKLPLPVLAVTVCAAIVVWAFVKGLNIK